MTETELHASALRAQVLERCRRTLHHDMNNAVQSIHSGLELLSKCLNAPGIARVSPQECITLLQQQFASLQRTLNKLISEIAEPPGAPEDFDLSALVQEAVQTLRHERGVHKARVQIDSGVSARARKANIRAFTLALLLDALDQLSAGAALEVTVHAKHGHATLEIRSPSQDVQDVQDESSQRGPAITQMVKHLVSAEEGELRVEQIAQERVVMLQLPAPAARHLDEDAKTTSDGLPLRVLIADRSRDAADSLAMILHLEGHEAIAVYSGTELADALKSFSPAVVLVDSDLPGCDIRHLAPLAGQLQPQPMLVKVSSSDRMPHEGFDAHLVRPVEWLRLQKLLDDHKRGK